MNWSVSTAKIFERCPRKYYYQIILAKEKSENSRVKEAAALNKLHNLYTWRGKAVDDIISFNIIPKIKNNETIKENEILANAKDTMRSDLDNLRFSIKNNSNVSNHGFFELEYNEKINDSLLSTIENEVLTSIKNFLHSPVYDELQKSIRLIAQRTLRFTLNDIKLACTPDLILFSGDGIPKIIDWKVESVFREHWLQLGIYGLALSTIKPHRDFPNGSENLLQDPKKIGLIEHQLLRNTAINYSLTKEDLIDIENYIHVSASRINNLIGSEKEIDMNNFPTTKYTDTCRKCQFRKLCWRELDDTN